MSAAHAIDPTTAAAPVLYLAFELGWTSWKLAFTVGAGQKPRLRSIAARDLNTLMIEIRKAKQRFGLAEATPVISGYEAGRDGFWLHRYLAHQGIENLVIDAASIEVNRRPRRAKSVHRELIEVKAQRTEHTNRIKGLLAGVGLSVVVDAELPRRLEGLRQWDGRGVPTGLRRRILREFERWQPVGRQIHELETRRSQELRDPQSGQEEQRKEIGVSSIFQEGNRRREIGPGRPGRLLSQGSHRSRRAQLRHPARHVTHSLRDGTPRGPRSLAEAVDASGSG